MSVVCSRCFSLVWAETRNTAQQSRAYRKTDARLSEKRVWRARITARGSAKTLSATDNRRDMVKRNRIETGEKR